MTAPRKARRDFGPVQLADHLGLARWQLDRALAAGLIPGPDRPRGRWSAAIADTALAVIGAICAAAGPVPDLGAVRAAEVLSGRLGLVVTADGAGELARRGLLPVTGYCKDHAVYDGRALEAFTGTAAAADGRLGRAAAHRRSGRRLPAYPPQRPGPPDPPRRPRPAKHGRGPFGPARAGQRAAVPHG